MGKRKWRGAFIFVVTRGRSDEDQRQHNSNEEWSDQGSKVPTQKNSWEKVLDRTRTETIFEYPRKGNAQDHGRVQAFHPSTIRLWSSIEHGHWAFAFTTCATSSRRDESDSKTSDPRTDLDKIHGKSLKERTTGTRKETAGQPKDEREIEVERKRRKQKKGPEDSAQLERKRIWRQSRKKLKRKKNGRKKGKLSRGKYPRSRCGREVSTAGCETTL